jgi:hypothetical protein
LSGVRALNARYPEPTPTPKMGQGASRFRLGPLGEGDGDNALVIVDAESEDAVRTRLADDPWGEDMLVTESLRPWSVWIRAEVRP